MKDGTGLLRGINALIWIIHNLLGIPLAFYTIEWLHWKTMKKRKHEAYVKQRIAWWSV
jgi:hypothetical protein